MITENEVTRWLYEQFSNTDYVASVDRTENEVVVHTFDGSVQVFKITVKEFRP